ncbi:hypothetical protein BT96DRAFT_919974 [Gymnopus androsaceus JB14]|uniref:Golgi apparatus membrane protein TVP38 n=1 Tax=Gymnopus androsaceus JB14 TaxID=1447944 RepID=A0A6A4HSG5_9AGAR|nr:hypothetical protein BT96DRAFT_919974 [Gymnopus androsaceus JB14]
MAFYQEPAPVYPKQTVQMYDRNAIARTPSPTPSETEALNSSGAGTGLVDLSSLKSKEFWFSVKGLIYGIGLLVIIALVVAFAVFHKDIVVGLEPATNWAKEQTVGWLIPVGILVILSFPPLFGHEFVGLLCGLTWGIGEGFGIMALGTLLGEAINYFVFKFCCTARARKLEDKKIMYACFARVIQDGGFMVVLAARYSLIPAHITTTIFAASGMKFFIFVAAAVLSLPKQLVTVYIGVLLGESINGTSSKERIASALLSVVSFIITTIAYKFLNREINKIKPEVIYERRKARQAANLKMLNSNTDSEESV